MYCVKCKKRTKTDNEQFTTSKNNRRVERVQYVEQLKHSLLNLKKVDLF